MSADSELVSKIVSNSSLKGSITRINNTGIEIWNHCLNSEFPISNKVYNNTTATCQIGTPHQGFTIITPVKHNNFNGKAKIIDPNGRLWAKFTYDKGEATGNCKLYYESGKLFYDGYMKDGYRNGRGTEYDESGEIMFDGFFINGLRNPLIRRNEEKRNYWNEVDDFGEVISICKRDIEGLYTGTCYFFQNGRISRISKWDHGLETELLHKFEGSNMISYRYGEETYKGEFKRITDFKYVRTDINKISILNLEIKRGGSVPSCCESFCYMVIRGILSIDCCIIITLAVLLTILSKKVSVTFIVCSVCCIYFSIFTCLCFWETGDCLIQGLVKKCLKRI